VRIAQIAPLFESVPPQLYGGTERVVSFLTEQLVQMGHEVTLFASGDSRTSARLEAMCPHSLRLDPHCVDSFATHVLMMDRVIERAHEFDVLHFHTDYLNFPFSRHFHLPSVTTLHGRLDIADLTPLYRRFHDAPVVSISLAQREPLAFARWVGNVQHGLPADLLPFTEKPQGYLAFLGRISPEKRVDRAIHIAMRTGIPLKVAAKIDRADREYFDKIKSLFEQPGIEFMGEIGDAQKGEFLGNACAYLFPIDWPEPFGLTMIEAMACGTPTIAFRRGSVPEVVDEGITGYIVDDVREAIQAVDRLDKIDRRRCRATFESRFTARRMAEAYLEIYERVANARPGASLPLRDSPIESSIANNA
jgi:glycosyltransferase involved in cell wall biosynthesis